MKLQVYNWLILTNKLLMSIKNQGNKSKEGKSGEVKTM